MRDPIRLGIIIPSSNTSAEPLSQAIVSSISTEERPITVHFTRISVTTLNLSPGSKSQFTPEALLAAAQLLADAKVSFLDRHQEKSVAGWIQKLTSIPKGLNHRMVRDKRWLVGFRK